MPSNKAAQAALAGNNLIIVLIVITFLVIGGAGVVGKALWSTISLDNKVLSAKDKADKQLTANVKNAPDLVKSYQSLNALNRVVSDALPITQDVPSMLVTLENMSAQTGLRIKSLAPVTSTVVAAAASTAAPAATSTSDANVGVPAPKSFQMSLAFEGTYDALTKFMKSIEMSARPMKLVNLQLSGSGNSLTGQADIQTYYQDKATLPIVMEPVK